MSVLVAYVLVSFPTLDYKKSKSQVPFLDEIVQKMFLIKMGVKFLTIDIILMLLPQLDDIVLVA
jgi:hypothetical protein